MTNEQKKEYTNLLSHPLTLDEYIAISHFVATEKGFHTLDNVDRDELLRRGNYPAFERLKRIQQMKDLALVMTEVAEAIEHLRRQPLLADKTKWKESAEEELADTVIRIFDFCGEHNVDLQYHINEKIKYNMDREQLHGKEM